MGVIIAQQSTEVQQGKQQFEISGLKTGNYIVTVTATDWKYTTKLISLGKNLENTSFKHKSIDQGSVHGNILNEPESARLQPSRP